jgi:hypothetical protein
VFHVFVEGAKDASPGGLQKLADAIAAHYGLPAADLRARLAAGRFRVKGNVDRATADRYVRDLEGLGARCKIEAVGGAQQFQSGLSAAFSGEMPAANLGALEKAASAFSLASVDGSDERAKAPPASAFAPPAPSEALDLHTLRPSQQKIVPAAPAAPEDPFAPPDAAKDLAVELAPEEAPAPARRPSLPPYAVTAPAPPPPVVAKPTSSHPLADERVRFVAGMVLAILIGFVPAHVISSIREHSAYAAIDRKVEAAQSLADTPESYARLDQVRAEQLDEKKDERRSIALLAFVIWGVAGGGIAYAWFRKLPWDRITGAA